MMNTDEYRQCQRCGICIGPSYYEKESYSWSINNHSVYTPGTGGYLPFRGWRTLLICGGCAKDPTLPRKPGTTITRAQ